MTVIPSMYRGSGRFRGKQVERILAGEEARDPVGGFLTAMVQDLRDVSRAEVPSGVAARHLLKMRLATEMEAGDPEPLLDVEEPVLPPARPLERHRPAVAALGLAAAMVVMVGIAASITGPRTGGTRAGSIVISEVPPRSAGGGLDRIITSDPQTADVECGTTPLSALAVSLTGEVAPVLSQWPAVCLPSNRPARVANTSGGAAVDTPLAMVAGGGYAGTLSGANSVRRSGLEVGGGGGSGGADPGSGTDGGSGNNPSSGGDTGGGQDPVGGGTGGTTEPGATAKGNANGHDKHRGKGGDGPGASGQKEKGSGKKAGH